MMKKNRAFAFLMQKKQLALPLLFALIGALLLLFSGTQTQKSAETVSETPFDDAALHTYEQALCAQLEQLCGAVGGVSDVRVALSFSRGFRREYLTDAKGEVITIGNGSGERALERALLPPEVGGVGVVCRHGDRPEVQQKLIELISTTLGIPSNRVFVIGR